MYTLSEAWSGMNFNDRSIILRPKHRAFYRSGRPVIKICPKCVLGSHEIRPIHSTPSLGESIVCINNGWTFIFLQIYIISTELKRIPSRENTEKRTWTNGNIPPNGLSRTEDECAPKLDGGYCWPFCQNWWSELAEEELTTDSMQEREGASRWWSFPTCHIHRPTKSIQLAQSKQHCSNRKWLLLNRSYCP